MSSIKKIAVLTSGGDSPGMNAAIRAVVRTGISQGLEVYGIHHGYSGLVEDDMRLMDVSSVGNILQRGGTILHTSRCKEFFQADVRAHCFKNLKKRGIEGLVVIGGDGSFNGAMDLFNEHNLRVSGIPGTIDNDISNMEYTLGFDSAVSSAVDAVDKIRDTASSHDRNFIVEVMGRKSTAIAMYVGICTGAENVIFADKNIPYEELAKDIRRGVKRGKNSSIIIMAEGDRPGLCYDVQKKFKDEYQIEIHACVLGHVQRGGTPTPKDRFMAAEMGYMSVMALIEDKIPASATAFQNGKLNLVPLQDCTTKTNGLMDKYKFLVKTLSI